MTHAEATLGDMFLAHCGFNWFVDQWKATSH